jgi:DNA polymerase (family 10)
VNVITHPANRSPALSDGYALDFDRLFAAAAETGTALEIDGAPGHLDLDGAIARRAAAADVMLAVDSDCHRMEALGRQMQFAVGTARRGWIEPQHVLNTRGIADIRAFVARKRARAS